VYFVCCTNYHIFVEKGTSATLQINSQQPATAVNLHVVNSILMEFGRCSMGLIVWVVDIYCRIYDSNVPPLELMGVE
jgi:hypothetical protein